MVRLTDAQLELLRTSRRAVLGTTSAKGRPRLVPVAFVVVDSDSELIVYSALDEKPKSVNDVHELARVRDIQARPQVSLLVDEWHEDWSRLRWLRLDGTATIVEPDPDDAQERDAAVTALRGRYPQYVTQRLEERPMIRIRVDRVIGWTAANEH